MSVVSSRCTFSSLLALSLLTSVQAGAAGFANPEQSITGLGSANAGMAAGGEDASAMFFNPAGLTRLGGTHFVAGTALVMPDSRFADRGSISVAGPNGGDGGQDRPLPHFYAMRQVDNDLRIGIAVTSPYGISTGYDDNWVGRYHAVTSTMSTLNIQPTAAYRVSDKLSLGTGLQIQYMETRLTNALDYAGLCLGFASVFACSVIPSIAPILDGNLRVTASGWGAGITLGALYEPSKSTRIGLGFRSGVSHVLKGDADFTLEGLGANLVVGNRNRFRDTDVEMKVVTPESLSLSLAQELDAKWTLLGDVTWTNWSQFKELRMHFGNSSEPDLVSEENWKDSFTVSAGALYRHSASWTFRFGAAFEQTPIRSAAYRTARIPDSDRIRLAVGASYAVSPAVRLDIGYAHLFMRAAPADNLDPTIQTPISFFRLNNTQRGSYSNHADILGIGISAKF